MMSPERLDNLLLAKLAPWRAAPAWRVALSGGLDSTVLLHLLASLARREMLPALRAIHVHHGLQAAADAWPQVCQRLCNGLGVELQVIGVEVAPGASVERAAREARYQAFAQCLAPGEVLMAAQHRDDQAETVLFRLLRGAGVRGLAAMPEVRALGAGQLLRPLLGVARAQLLAYAQHHGLQWIEDPTNVDEHYARNFLRASVFPLLARQWPQASATLARTAAHLGEAQTLLDELAELDIASAVSRHAFDWLGTPSLSLEVLRAFSPARQRNALRHWLAAYTPLPDTDHWAGWDDLRDAQADASPVWKLAQGELRRGEGHVWWLGGQWLDGTPPGAVAWQTPEHPLELPGNGRVFFAGQAPSGHLRIEYRRGGEVLSIPGRGHRDLKRLLNESGLPTFVRGRLPLLYSGEELLAVANLPGLGTDGVLRWVPLRYVKSATDE